MGRSAILLASTLSAFLLAFTLASAPAMAAEVPSDGEAVTPMELQFTKGDTRQGAQVRIRVTADSLHYSRTSFEPGQDAVRSFRSARLDARRKIALKRILGELPRFRVFGSCFGKDMRYYLLDTPAGKFYRSLPERSGRCFTDEPGILPFLEDLDTFIAPPLEPAPGDYSASAS